MLCSSCGAEVAAGGKHCSRCGTCVEPVSGQTRPLSVPSATRIFQEKDLGKTVVFRPQVTAKPIYGWLVITDGPDSWRDFRIGCDDGQILVGNGEECQLKLQDEQLAKVHASIRLLEGKLTITDLDTLTGTSVNQNPITKSDLQDGDEVRAGNTTIKFRRL